MGARKVSGPFEAPVLWVSGDLQCLPHSRFYFHAQIKELGLKAAPFKAFPAYFPLGFGGRFEMRPLFIYLVFDYRFSPLIRWISSPTGETIRKKGKAILNVFAF